MISNDEFWPVRFLNIVALIEHFGQARIIGVAFCAYGIPAGGTGTGNLGTLGNSLDEVEVGNKRTAEGDHLRNTCSEQCRTVFGLRISETSLKGRGDRGRQRNSAFLMILPQLAMISSRLDRVASGKHDFQKLSLQQTGSNRPMPDIAVGLIADHHSAKATALPTNRTLYPMLGLQGCVSFVFSSPCFLQKAGNRSSVKQGAMPP